MYLHYFGLRDKPFNLTPDPRFYYTNPLYQETYASLLYGIRERRGFIVLTGEAGTGKTTLLRRLMSNVEKPVHVVYVYHTTFTFDEVLSFTCGDLGLPMKDDSRLRRIQALNEFLRARFQEGGTGALLIDEAQNLSDEVLENLHQLWNLEIAGEKLLQIVLVGQPELEVKLAQPNLRQLKQRVAIYCQLASLKEHEVGPFIAHRLRTVGCERQDLFHPEAVQRIAQYSRGIPRLINLLCDNALLIAYSISQQTVSAAVIERVAQDLWLATGPDELRRNPILRPASLSASVETQPVRQEPEVISNQVPVVIHASQENEPPSVRVPPRLPRTRFALSFVLLLLSGVGVTLYVSLAPTHLSELRLQARDLFGTARGQLVAWHQGLSARFVSPSTKKTEHDKAQDVVQPPSMVEPVLQPQEPPVALAPDLPLVSATLPQSVASQEPTPLVNPQINRQADLEQLRKEEERKKAEESQQVALAFLRQKEQLEKERLEKERLEKLRLEEEARRKAEETQRKSEEARLLLEQMGYSSSEAALLESAENGQTGVVELLLSAGLSPNQKDAKNWTPLMYAAWNGHSGTVQVLLEKDADVQAKNGTEGTALTLAVINGHLSVVQALINKGASVDAKDAKGWTPLMYAAWNGQTAILQVLCKKGADVNAKDQEGWTPLMYAAWNGHSAAVRTLLEKKAVANAENIEGETALAMAVEQENTEIVQLLTQAGAQRGSN